jgi:F-type H+-transporting ATPase subunit b
MTFNGWTFLFQTLNFVVLAYVLYRLLYRPLREAIARRREVVAQQQAAAEKARHEAEALQQRLHGQLAEMEQQRQEMIRQAREQAESERQKLLGETERLLQQRRDDARQALERERDEALRALHGEVVGQALGLAERLLRESADRTLHRQLALRLAETLNDVPESECVDLRAGWIVADGAVLETARELDAATLTQVTDAVKALAGVDVALTVQTRPALLGGARLRLGGHVWDGSLAGQFPGGNGVAGGPVP